MNHFRQLEGYAGLYGDRLFPQENSLSITIRWFWHHSERRGQCCGDGHVLHPHPMCIIAVFKCLSTVGRQNRWSRSPTLTPVLLLTGGSAQGKRHQGIHREFTAEARAGGVQVPQVLQHQARPRPPLQVRTRPRTPPHGAPRGPAAADAERPRPGRQWPPESPSQSPWAPWIWLGLGTPVSRLR